MSSRQKQNETSRIAKHIRQCLQDLQKSHMQTRHEQWRGLCLRHHQVTRDKRSKFKVFCLSLTKAGARSKENHKQNLHMENVQFAVLLSVENFTRCRFDTNQCLGAYVFRILSADSAYGFSTLTVGSFCPQKTQRLVYHVWLVETFQPYLAINSSGLPQYPTKIAYFAALQIVCLASLECICAINDLDYCTHSFPKST